MSYPQHYLLAKFGIDEIYFLKSLPYDLLEKLHRWASLSLDAENPIILKHVSQDMVLIFHKQIPSQSLIYRFVEQLDKDKSKQEFIQSNTLINQDELLAAIKSQKYVLITPKTLIKTTYEPV